MLEYVEKEAVCKALSQDYAYAAADIVRNLPAADVAPVVHARWIRINNENEQIIKCSACGYPVSYFWGRTPYCPSCGAKMNGKGV